ncbi:unnamed protein product [Mytilus edulis]|uniref:Uncharacterized protein n=1 Tax=Mytilus edulis TaxID=6550 RepID=A0A8S3TLU7_MYTED|nr:unnamed protein product [Mytilus edulis]
MSDLLICRARIYHENLVPLVDDVDCMFSELATPEKALPSYVSVNKMINSLRSVPPDGLLACTISDGKDDHYNMADNDNSFRTQLHQHKNVMYIIVKACDLHTADFDLNCFVSTDTMSSIKYDILRGQQCKVCLHFQNTVRIAQLTVEYCNQLNCIN